MPTGTVVQALGAATAFVPSLRLREPDARAQPTSCWLGAAITCADPHRTVS